MIKLNDVLIKSAEKGLELQEDSGRMPPGSNGPWNDKETPVRNTSHWSITFLRVYEITDDQRFLEAGKKCADFILEDRFRPEGETFQCRINPEKDFCNGLIGQAWVIEALSKAYETTEEEKYHETAVKVFKKHPFDEILGIWKSVDTDGEILGYDTTFNHQLWFAASGSMLKDKEIKKQVNEFMDRLEGNLSIHENGLVQHKLSPNLSLKESIKALKEKRLGTINLKVEDLDRKWKDDSKFRDKVEKRAVGYHSFNMYGLALLNENYPNHSFWKSDKFKETLEAINSEEYKSKVEGNKYSYPYNPPGIENAYTIQTFDELSSGRAERWLEKQFEKTFDFETNLMERKSSDKETCSARIYEATRLSNMELDVNNDD